MWEYHSDYNYYDCFLGEHRLVVQPFHTSYGVRLYLGKAQFVEIKTYIEAENIEDAKEKAMKIVSLHAERNMNFWKNIVNMADKNIKWIK